MHGMNKKNYDWPSDPVQRTSCGKTSWLRTKNIGRDLVAKARQLQILQRIDPDKPALYPPPARQAELLREIRGRPAVEDVGAQRLDEEAERQRDQLEFE